MVIVFMENWNLCSKLWAFKVTATVKNYIGYGIIHFFSAQRLGFLFGIGLLLVNGLVTSAEHHVVNSSVTQNIGSSELRSIFSMRRRSWKDGSAIHVFVLPDTHPTHKAFCKNKLGIFPHRLRKIWDRLVFTGTGQAPTEVQSLEEMRSKVMQTPGAIGYLPGITTEPFHSREQADEK